MKKVNFTTDPGWEGLYTREEAVGAMPNGTRVRKVISKPEDGHRDGALATIIGSFAAGDGAPINVKGHLVRYFYFVEWDDMPKVGVGVSEHRIEAVLN